MPGRMSVRQKTQDRNTAREAAYRTETNPFAAGSRLHRYFEKAAQHRRNMDVIFDDLETVYGPIGVKRARAV